jgi:hypothetical protein
VIAQAQSLLHEWLGLAQDRFHLAALETRRAGESLVAMIVAGMLVGADAGGATRTAFGLWVLSVYLVVATVAHLRTTVFRHTLLTARADSALHRTEDAAAAHGAVAPHLPETVDAGSLSYPPPVPRVVLRVPEVVSRLVVEHVHALLLREADRVDPHRDEAQHHEGEDDTCSDRALRASRLAGRRQGWGGSGGGVGDEGGEILLGKAATNTTLTGSGVTVDVFQNRLRFFEQGGSARGFYLDISTGGSGASTI